MKFRVSPGFDTTAGYPAGKMVQFRQEPARIQSRQIQFSFITTPEEIVIFFLLPGEMPLKRSVKDIDAG
jgi:hypothetical protein